MNSQLIDKGNDFDFGRTSAAYAAYRDIYPKSMYDKLISFGIGKKGQQILDLGSGTAVLPVNLSHTGAQFVATDISENQVAYGKRLTDQKGIPNIRFKVCSAEETGFADNSFDVVTAVQCFQYFDAEKAADEITRVLKPQKLFCKIFMDWLPLEDAVIAEMEKLVLQYNPAWSGNGFDQYRYRYPEWAEGHKLITLTEKGFGKRMSTALFENKGRAIKGMCAHKIGAKTGELVGIAVVEEGEDILIITDDGTVIRTSADGIPAYGRTASGVIVMRVGDSKIVNFTVTGKAPEEEELPEGETPEGEITEGGETPPETEPTPETEEEPAE